MNGLFYALCVLEVEDDSPVSLAIQYSVYLAVIILCIVILGLIRRKQKPLTHAELHDKLVLLSDKLTAFIKYLRGDRHGQYDFFRATQKLIYLTNKLIYHTNVLADKERDSAITNIALSIERAKNLMLDFKTSWKASGDESGAELYKLSLASDQLRQAVSAINKIIERDRQLRTRRTRKHG